MLAEAMFVLGPIRIYFLSITQGECYSIHHFLASWDYWSGTSNTNGEERWSGPCPDQDSDRYGNSLPIFKHSAICLLFLHNKPSFSPQQLFIFSDVDTVVTLPKRFQGSHVGSFLLYCRCAYCDSRLSLTYESFPFRVLHILFVSPDYNAPPDASLNSNVGLYTPTPPLYGSPSTPPWWSIYRFLFYSPMRSSTMLSTATLAFSLMPLLSHCVPLLGVDPGEKAGLEHKRDDNFVTQAQFVTASTISVTPALSSPSAAASIPPDAFPTRPAASGSPQPAPSQPQAAASVPAPAVPLIMAYYPDWASFAPEKIDFKRFDWIDFAFAVPDRNFNLAWDDPKAPDMLRRLVSTAHAGGKKVKLSVGGWSGSK
jgi:hypothetical protein